MSIEEQIAQALAEGKRIKMMAHNLWWFAMHAASWAISADLRNIATEIVGDSYSGTPKESLAFRCFDLAIRIALEEPAQNIASRAREVIYQVQSTCEI